MPVVVEVISMLVAVLVMGFVVGMVASIPFLYKSDEKVWNYYMTHGNGERKGDSY